MLQGTGPGTCLVPAMHPVPATLRERALVKARSPATRPAKERALVRGPARESRLATASPAVPRSASGSVEVSDWVVGRS
jgi:hypothetical protein